MKKVVFFSGLGSELPYMGKKAYMTDPNFQKWMDHCAFLAEEYIEGSLTEILYGDSKAWLENLRIVKYALFSVQYSMAKAMFAEHTPDLCFGFSLGEFVSLTFAGWISLEDIFHFISNYSDVLENSPASVTFCIACDYQNLSQLSQELNCFFEVTARLNKRTYAIVIRKEDTEHFTHYFKSKSYSYLALNTSIGFHSRLIEPFQNKILSKIPKSQKKNHPEVFSSVSSKILASTSTDFYWQVLRRSFDIPKALEDISSLFSFRVYDMSPTRFYEGYFRKEIQCSNKPVVDRVIECR